MKNILVTAHTGCNGSPPNTLESVKTGQELGADINEIDIRSTSDGIPILWHDDALPTRSNGLLKIEDLQFSDILNLEQKGEIEFPHLGSIITTLEEVFEAFAASDIFFNLDLKDDECIVPVARLVRDFGITDRVVFSGCEKVRASYLKSNYADFQVLLNVDEKLLKNDRFSRDEKSRIICETAVSAGCCGLNIRHNFCDGELVQRAASRFLPVAVWTVNSPQDFDRFIEMGVASITAMDVTALRNRLASNDRVLRVENQ